MPHGQYPDLSEPSKDGVSRFALRALSTLTPEAIRPRPPMESYLGQMFDAAIGPDPRALETVVQGMRKARVPVSQIAESYVPIIARRLGEDWVADTLAFGAVTIGSARLQGLLRQLGSDWGVPQHSVNFDRPAFLVGVPRGVQHTLGAGVLAGYLRHRGMSVHLDLELTPERLRDTLSRRTFRGLLLSSSGRAHLQALCDLVAQAKDEGQGTPIIVGGHIQEHEPEVRSLTGADLATSDPATAIAHCETIAAGGSAVVIR